MWAAPAGAALLCSVIVREPPRLLSLLAGVAVAETCEAFGAAAAALKWPNDVLIGGRKVAGILVEGRPQEGWAVVGVGVNVAVRVEELPPELADRAGSLELAPTDVDAVLARFLEGLERWLAASRDAVLDAVRARDALLGRPVSWAGGAGTGAGIDDDGRLLVQTADGLVALDAGEVHLGALDL